MWPHIPTDFPSQHCVKSLVNPPDERHSAALASQNCCSPPPEDGEAATQPEAEAEPEALNAAERTANVFNGQVGGRPKKNAI